MKYPKPRYEKKGNKLYVYFPGTGGGADDNPLVGEKSEGPKKSSIIGWVTNFRFAKKPYKRMNQKWYVHKGFLKIWKEREDEFAEYLTKDIKEIHIEGYSQGGTSAGLACEYVWFHRPDLRNNLHVTTKGSPRFLSIFGYKKVEERFENVIRKEARGDLVCRLPFFFMLFKHVGKLNKIGKFTLNFIKAHQSY